MWRKNRAVTANSSCRGVDLNRNFPVGWGSRETDSVGLDSDSPCSDCKSFYFLMQMVVPDKFLLIIHQYILARHFSLEKNRVLLHDLIIADRGRVKIAFSLHARAQKLMSAYAFKKEKPFNYTELVIQIENKFCDLHFYISGNILSYA